MVRSSFVSCDKEQLTEVHPGPAFWTKRVAFFPLVSQNRSETTLRKKQTKKKKRETVNALTLRFLRLLSVYFNSLLNPASSCSLFSSAPLRPSRPTTWLLWQQSHKMAVRGAECWKAQEWKPFSHRSRPGHRERGLSLYAWRTVKISLKAFYREDYVCLGFLMYSTNKPLGPSRVF